MSQITLPHSIASGDADNPTRDMANWTTIRDIINGNLDNTNISASAAIEKSKLQETMLGYAEITSNFTGAAGTTAVTDVTGLSVAVTVPSGGRRIKITGYANMYNQTSAADLYFYIRESSTELNHADQQAGAANDVNGVIAMWIGTPSAGAHTYKLSISSNVAGPNIGAAATNPAFILVELL